MDMNSFAKTDLFFLNNQQLKDVKIDLYNQMKRKYNNSNRTLKKRSKEMTKENYIKLLDKQLKSKFSDNDTVEKIFSRQTVEKIFYQIFTTFKDNFNMEILYDLTIHICYHYMVEINNVYLINPVTKYVVNMMGLEVKKYVNQDLSLDYVLVNDVLKYFENNKLELFENDPETIVFLDGEIINQLLIQNFFSGTFSKITNIPNK